MQQLMKIRAQCYLCEDCIQGHRVESVVNLPQLLTHVHKLENQKVNTM